MTFWKEGGAGASAATTCDRARRRVFIPAQRRLQVAGVLSKGWVGRPGGGGRGRAGAPVRGLRATAPT